MNTMLMKQQKVKMSKIFCWLFGHVFVDVGKHDNGRTKWGTKMCARCGTRIEWQFDYNI